MQGPVSFSDMGIRPVNRLQVMQYRYLTGLCICVLYKFDAGFHMSIDLWPQTKFT